MNPSNLLSLILTIFLHSIPSSISRGPHHPQGSHIVKRHTHYTPLKTNEKLTQDRELLQDKQHIQEHLEELIPKVDVSKMSPDELELYYFLVHDTDKNSKLDGLELLHSIIHTTHEDNHDDEDVHQELEDGLDGEVFNRFVDMVDEALREDDKNQDGYIDYSEYVDGSKRVKQKPLSLN